MSDQPARQEQLSLAEATATLTAPGQMFEIGEEPIRGVPTRVWKQAPPTLRAVLWRSNCCDNSAQNPAAVQRNCDENTVR